MSSKAREHPFATSSRALLLLAIGGSFVIAATPARAACALTDLACTTETVTTTVTETVAEGTEPVTEVTDPVTETIGGVVDEVNDTVRPIVDEVPQLSDPAVNVTDPPTADESNAPGARRGSTDPSGDSGHGRSDVVSGSVVEPTVPVQALVRDAFVSGLDPGPGPDVRIGPSPPAERTGVSLQDLLTAGFAFPFALVLIVGAFLLVQDRLDRRDPRLALAPVGPDVLDFT
ncbi:MAG TPA: hypothetical protein VFY08_07110 [Actinomycetota bacterium]|nr:hypothetical protein [Actinomycetota bacterium]